MDITMLLPLAVEAVNRNLSSCDQKTKDAAIAPAGGVVVLGDHLVTSDHPLANLCETCRYFRDGPPARLYGDGVGCCLRYPPSVTIPQGSGYETRFPIVNITMGCGEFKSRA